MSESLVISNRMLRPAKYREILGTNKTGEHRQRHEGLLPPPVQIGPRAKALPEYEVEIIRKARVAGASPDELREIVQRLLAARKSDLNELLKEVGA